MKLLLATLLALMPTAALADHRHTYSQPGWSASQSCVKKVYREEYVPGTVSNPGYVKQYYDEVKVPCERVTYHTSPPEHQNRTSDRPRNRNCTRGSILGGILGGGIAAGLSKPDAMVWSIPVGVVTGAIAGCEVENGG